MRFRRRMTKFRSEILTFPAMNTTLQAAPLPLPDWIARAVSPPVRWKKLTSIHEAGDAAEIVVLLTNGQECAARVSRVPEGWKLEGAPLDQVAGWRMPCPGLAVGAGETALQMVLRERGRQIVALGFDARHDDCHRGGELARAAGCHLQCSTGAVVKGWPFESPRFTPSDSPVRSLVKAAALCLAELERRLRAGEDETLTVEAAA